MSGKTKTPHTQALQTAEALVDLLRMHCERIEIAGSIRRGEPMVGDVEIVAIAKDSLLPFTDDLVQRGIGAKALYGEKNTTRWGGKYRGVQYQGMKCELFIAEPDNYGATLWLRTGGGDKNKFVMQHLIRTNAPVRTSEGYWHYKGALVPTPEEQDVYDLLGLPFIPPAERTEQRYRALLTAKGHKYPDSSKKARRAGTARLLIDTDADPYRGGRHVIFTTDPFGKPLDEAEIRARHADRVRELEQQLQQMRLDLSVAQMKTKDPKFAPIRADYERMGGMFVISAAKGRVRAAIQRYERRECSADEYKAAIGEMHHIEALVGEYNRWGGQALSLTWFDIPRIERQLKEAQAEYAALFGQVAA